MTLYKSPNQSQDQFESFSNNFESNLEKLAQKDPFLRVALDDFKAKTTGLNTIKPLLKAIKLKTFHRSLGFIRH